MCRSLQTRLRRYLVGTVAGTDRLLIYNASAAPVFVDATSSYLGTVTELTLSCAFADLNNDGKLELILAKTASVIIYSDASASTAYAVEVAPVMTARLNDMTPFLGATVTANDLTSGCVQETMFVTAVVTL